MNVAPSMYVSSEVVSTRLHRRSINTKKSGARIYKDTSPYLPHRIDQGDERKGVKDKAKGPRTFVSLFEILRPPAHRPGRRKVFKVNIPFRDERDKARYDSDVPRAKKALTPLE